MNAATDLVADPPRERTASHGRIVSILERNPFPILLVSLVGIVLLSVFAPAIVVGDTWLTLMAGREVVDHGLPHTEHITMLGEGRTWTDQQWLAQVVFYAAHELAGMRAVILLGIALVLVALALTAATARTSGASSRSTFILGFLAVLAGPWGWTLRAQTTALPLFAGTLWLLVDASRRGVRKRSLLVLPLLVVWANLHGSVVLGAMLTVLLGIMELIRRRRLGWLPAVLVVFAPLCVLARTVVPRDGEEQPVLRAEAAQDRLERDAGAVGDGRQADVVVALRPEPLERRLEDRIGRPRRRRRAGAHGVGPRRRFHRRHFVSV